MITVRRIKKMDNGNIKAFFDVTINGIDIDGLKLATNKTDGNMFLSFPSEKGKDDKYYNTVYISDIELKQEVETKLIETYNRSM